ncbi:MAG: Ni/Fe-hydrogenase cytochrome b subunit [Planctomycetes bacterium]|nr:Ni/Fe-hydrogenase cytochrome b subunit [Planctomycetota bacterium]
MSRRNWNPGFWKTLFFIVLAAGLVVFWMRWTRGLGSVTHLSDAFPWGLWVGFDILCGIGLAAGGFLITAVVYIFRLERFKPIVRPALMTAFIGYMLEVLALMLDLGRPWNLWRPLFSWNPDSVMFVVAWCVTVYSVVLAAELSGMIFEKLGWKRAQVIQRRATIPLVILGVVLSIVHQSSLGGLYLTIPGKMHELWYSNFLPLLFLVSAVSVGLAMIVVESRISGRVFGHHLGGRTLTELGVAQLVMLGIYALVRFSDLAARGALPAAMDLGYESGLFWLEVGVGLILPALLLMVALKRSNLRLLYGASLLTVLGFILHRLNVSMTALESSRGEHYVPAIPEAIATLMFVGLGFAAFRLAARYLQVFPHEGDHARLGDGRAS